MIEFNTEQYCKEYMSTSSIKKKIYAIRYMFDIRKYVSKGKLLDIGCASGDLMKVAKVFGYDCYGIDISQPLIDLALKSKLKVELATLEEMAYPDKMFDVITILSVLQYVDNKVQFMSEVKRVLKDDGIFLIHCPVDLVPYAEMLDIMNQCNFEIIFTRQGMSKQYTELICKKGIK